MRYWVIVVCCLAAIASTAKAQKAPKQDSVAIDLAMPKDRAADAVVAAFTSAGLSVTATSPNLVTADLGEISAIGHGTNHMTVRATIVPRDTVSSVVVIRGDARGVSPATGTSRITNKQKGPYKKVWQQIEAAAKALAATPAP